MVGKVNVFLDVPSAKDTAHHTISPSSKNEAAPFWAETQCLPAWARANSTPTLHTHANTHTHRQTHTAHPYNIHSNF